MSQDNDAFADVGHINDPLARLSAVLEIWRDKLVSFDGRNRQLYYRRLKSGDVDFDDKEIDKNALRLLLSDKPVKVSVLYPNLFNKIKPKTKIDLSIDENLELEDDSQDDEEMDFAEQWSKRLRKFEAVYRKAKENFDEKNIETCFLAEGFITWKNLKPGPTPHAPLILHPIKIEPTARGNSDFSVIKTGEAFYNQALVLYLQKDFGIDPALFENESDLGVGKESLKPVLKVLEESVTGYKFFNEKVLGNFSFLKYPMVQDINRIIGANTSHMILSALSGNDKSVQEISDTGKEFDLEYLSELNPISENLIFPADSSQHSAISAVIGGKSVVIQGPPGSGKSQTIANLIAEAVINNKKILFVAEKRAAIDAVVERLTEKGLGGVVLDLHGEPDKKTIAKNLLSAVKTYGLPQRLSHTDEVALNGAKKRLNSRWKWLHTPSGIKNIEGVELSNYEALIELGDVRSGLPEKVIAQSLLLQSAADSISVEVRDEIKTVFSELYDLGYFEERFQKSQDLKEFSNLVESNEAELIVNSLRNLQSSFESPYWNKIRNLFKKAFKIQVKNIHEFRSAFEDIRIHSTYIYYFNLEELSDLEALTPALLSLSEF